MDRADHTLRALGARCPELISFFSELNSEDVPWGIFSGAAVHLLTGVRRINDLDILIDNGSFDTVARLRPQASLRRNKSITVLAGDGAELRYAADELAEVIGGMAVQIMRPTTPIMCGDSRYELSMTGLARSARLEYRVGDVSAYIAHPFDTKAAKAMLQRGPEQGKYDISDALAIEPLCRGADDYAAARAIEMGLDARAKRFMDWVGGKAVEQSIEVDYRSSLGAAAL